MQEAVNVEVRKILILKIKSQATDDRVKGVLVLKWVSLFTIRIQSMYYINFFLKNI